MKSTGAHEKIRKDQTVKPRIPQSLKLEHEELHAELAKAIKAGGGTGSAAEIVAKLLHPHFVKEEEYALPPLGLLPMLAEGKVTPEMEGVLEMTGKLKAELPRMLEEHHNIVEALKKLSTAAEKEKKTEYVGFAEKLMSHARNEEEVLYPAAILAGEYIKLKLNK
ncbi:MAG TPA: hemerythrin domain-containing protein [Blastocatellia bacterium]|nr:hemerythrin domain-containing protein [Blastocatellia bacterium]